MLGGAAIALAALPFAVNVHLRSACIEQDTPYLPICPEPPSAPEALRQQLKDRIAHNPGDSLAWVQLLVSGTPAEADAVLPGAIVVAPHNHNVEQWEAAQALQRGQVQKGLDLMIDLLRHRRSPPSERVVAQIVASPGALALLRPYLASAAEWLPQVLDASYELKLAPGDLLPVVAAAMEMNALPDVTRQKYMRLLKSKGQWLDAYGLWVAGHKEFVPLLYNGGFDQAVDPDGFDWEFANGPRSRAGTIVEQEAVARRGLVLDIEFTGRSFAAPVLRQFLFLAPGTYRLHGEYTAPKLRSEEGLAWSVQCVAGSKAAIGRSAALRETGGVWRSLDFEFTVPPDCGPVASLQLDPAAPYEATTGMKGNVSLDAFSLARAVPSQ